MTSPTPSFTLPGIFTTTPRFTIPTVTTTTKRFTIRTTTAPTTTTPEIVTTVSDVTEGEITFASTSELTTAEDETPEDGSNVALIAGLSSVVVVLILAGLIIGFIVFCRKRHKTPHNSSRRPTMLPSAEEIDNISRLQQDGRLQGTVVEAEDDEDQATGQSNDFWTKDKKKKPPTIHVKYNEYDNQHEFVPPSNQTNLNRGCVDENDSDDEREIYDFPKPSPLPPQKGSEGPVYENHVAVPKPHMHKGKHTYVNAPGHYVQSNVGILSSENDNHSVSSEPDYINKDVLQQYRKQANANQIARELKGSYNNNNVVSSDIEATSADQTVDTNNESPYVNTSFPTTLPRVKRPPQTEPVTPAISMDNLGIQRPNVAPKQPMKTKRLNKLHQPQNIGNMINESEFSGNRVS